MAASPIPPATRPRREGGEAFRPGSGQGKLCCSPLAIASIEGPCPPVTVMGNCGRAACAKPPPVSRSARRKGHVPMPFVCGTCGEPFGRPACASTEHKRIETDIALGVRKEDGRPKPRLHTSNRRTPAEIATLKAMKAREKAVLRGKVKTILDQPP